MSASDSDGELGNLFAEADADPPPEYPIEEHIVAREGLQREGTTSPKFTPRLGQFLSATPRGESRHDSGEVLVELDETVAKVQRDFHALHPIRLFVRNKRHSLWGHMLWNAAKYLAKRMDSGLLPVRGKSVLELGAGLGFPSLIAYRNGARCVVVTDYPDQELLEVIQKNVDENCKPELLDPDAGEALLLYAEEAKRNLRVPSEDSKDAHPEECGASRYARVAGRSAVLPLEWGKEDDIQGVLAQTGGSGFDIVILSDILFNHLCNADLVATVTRTLLRDPSAAAYCVFSHHRARKQKEDLDFFDLCVAQGLQWEKIDEEIYPLMFPDDVGPESLRGPVHVYKITHFFDDAGAGLEHQGCKGAEKSESAALRYDAVIQGTGLTQSVLSAALSRCGLRVLHCDGSAHYGGPVATFTLDQLLGVVGAQASPPESGMGASRLPEITLERCRLEHGASGRVFTARERRQTLIDLLPSTYLANGETIAALAESNMAKYLELYNVDRFILLQEGGSSGLTINPIPLTRSDVFASSLFTPLEMRRLMKLVKDFDATLAEQEHADASNVLLTRGPRQGVAARGGTLGDIFESEGKKHPNDRFSDLLRRQYNLSQTTIDVMTFAGALDLPSVPLAEHPISASAHLLRTVLLSLGKYGGRTPFLVPAFGSCELAQSLCRTSAVWGATFVLRRCVRGVFAADGNQSVVLSNGQHVMARALVMPQELLPPSTEAAIPIPARLARVVVLAKRPLLPWNAIHASEEGSSGVTPWLLRSGRAKRDGDAAAAGAAANPPIVVAVMKLAMGGVDGASGERSTTTVYIVQQGAGTEQTPPNGEEVLVHFTADAACLSESQLSDLVARHFTVSSTEPMHAEPDGSSNRVPAWRYATREPPLTSGAACNSRSAEDDDVLLWLRFTLDARDVALDSVCLGKRSHPLPRNQGDPYACLQTDEDPFVCMSEKLAMSKAYDIKKSVMWTPTGSPVVEHVAKDQTPPALSGVYGVTTLSANILDDSVHVREAKEVFHAIISRLHEVYSTWGKAAFAANALPSALKSRDGDLTGAPSPIEETLPRDEFMKRFVFMDPVSDQTDSGAVATAAGAPSGAGGSREDRVTQLLRQAPLVSTASAEAKDQ